MYSTIIVQSSSTTSRASRNPFVSFEIYMCSISARSRVQRSLHIASTERVLSHFSHTFVPHHIRSHTFSTRHPFLRTHIHTHLCARIIETIESRSSSALLCDHVRESSNVLHKRFACVSYTYVYVYVKRRTRFWHANRSAALHMRII